MASTAEYPALEVLDLRKIYNERSANPVNALRGISFSVRKGQIFGLLGPNGAGKSTTIKILTTLLRPTAGTARVMGFDVLTNGLDARRSMCAVMQDNAVEVFLSVRNNFRVYGRFQGLSTADTDTATDRVAELFGLRDILNTKGTELSGGQKRRLQVAKTFMVDKPVVFLDEATTGMDTFSKRATHEAIKREASRGRTIVLTTHMIDEAEDLCDSLAIVNHGSVIASGSLREVKSLGLRLFTVNLAFDRVTRSSVRILERLNPHKVEASADGIEVMVRNESEALRVVHAARRLRGFRHFEVAAATLEDVFVDIVDRPTKEGSR